MNAADLLRRSRLDRARKLVHLAGYALIPAGSLVTLRCRHDCHTCDYLTRLAAGGTPALSASATESLASHVGRCGATPSALTSCGRALAEATSG